MSKPRISFFVHNLVDNPIGRAALLASALQAEFDVEVLGFLMGGDEVNEPYRNLFAYRTIRCRDTVSEILKMTPQLAKLATGDVIYACKPLLTSFGPALKASNFGLSKPLLLDVEDDEWAVTYKSNIDFIRRYLLKGWRHATSWKYTLLLHTATFCVGGVSVSSRKLQERYGGTIVRHGPDDLIFDPNRFASRDKLCLRESFSLPPKVPLVLFAGTPRAHKGLDILLKALLRPECADWSLVLVGGYDWPEFVQMNEMLKNRCYRLGFVSRELMPSLMSTVDAVPAPQRRVPFTESQVPAKVLDAMSMALPVVATRVGDLPEILGDGARGWLIQPDDAVGLAQALAEIAANPPEARRRGDAARAWFLKESSSQAIRRKLVPLITTALAARRK